MTYIGETNSKGERHGQGTETYADGRTYTGEFKDGLPHGQGIFTDADGKRYPVEYKDGELFRTPNWSRIVLALLVVVGFLWLAWRYFSGL